MIHQCEFLEIVMVYNRYQDRIQHNQPQQGSSKSTKLLSKNACKRDAPEENSTDEEEAPLSGFTSGKRAFAKSESAVGSLLDVTE